MYLDAAQDRITHDGHVRMANAAMAARLGNAENKSWRRWWSKQQARIKGASGSIGLTGESLERAVFGLAMRNPEYVVVGG
jgi:hypothetical protein